MGQVSGNLNPGEMAKHAGTFDFILDAVSAEHDINGLLGMLAPDSNMTLIGAPGKPFPVSSFGLIFGGKSLSGSFAVGPIPRFADQQKAPAWMTGGGVGRWL